MCATLAWNRGTEAVAAHVLEGFLALPPRMRDVSWKARSNQASAAPSIWSALAEKENTVGDQKRPPTMPRKRCRPRPKWRYTTSMPAYSPLNKKQRGAAIGYYAKFLTLAQLNPALIDASLDAIRQRLKYLEIHS